jgi:hypothetical protein
MGPDEMLWNAREARARVERLADHGMTGFDAAIADGLVRPDEADAVSRYPVELAHAFDALDGWMCEYGTPPTDWASPTRGQAARDDAAVRWVDETGGVL